MLARHQKSIYSRTPGPLTIELMFIIIVLCYRAIWNMIERGGKTTLIICAVVSLGVLFYLTWYDGFASLVHDKYKQLATNPHLVFSSHELPDENHHEAVYSGSPRQRLEQLINCTDVIDTSPDNMCNFLSFLKIGGCVRNRQTIGAWSPTLNKCKENPLPLTCSPVTNSTSKKRITFKVSGRLGNNLYQFAVMYSLAILHNMTPVISKSCGITQLFKLPNVTIVDDADPGARWAKFIQHPEFNYDQRSRFLDNTKDIQLCGFFQSYKYMEDVGEQHVLDQLQVKDEFVAAADSFLRKETLKALGGSSIPPGIVYVGIHVRRGDLAAYNYIRAPDVGYFNRAMKYFTDRFKDKVIFVVCSEDMKWSRANIINTRPVIFSEKNSYQVDFALLSGCNHTVRSLGSFGDWVGYLSRGTTIYFNNSFLVDRLGKTKDGGSCDRKDGNEPYFPNFVMMP